MNNPSVRMLAGIKTNMHLCTDAVLVRVQGGLGALRVLQHYHGGPWERFYDHRVMLRDRALTRARLPEIGTGLDDLAFGYGIENVDLPELTAVRDRLNAPYAGIEEALDRLSRFFGLLPDGLYLLVDHEAFPVEPKRGSEYRGQAEHFWNADYQNSYLLKPYPYHLEMPWFLFPSESTRCFDPARMAHYVAMDPGSYRFPRALCLYLDGGMGLILDGHHKAAAAVQTGQRARCTSIMPVVAGEGLDAALQSGERLTLNQRYGYGNTYHGSGMNICVKGGVPVAKVNSFMDQAEVQQTMADWQAVPENAPMPAAVAPVMEAYPDLRQLAAAVFIPKARIRAAYEEFSAQYERFFAGGMYGYSDWIGYPLRCGYEVLGYRILREEEYRRVVVLDNMFKER